jgi:hypothetical protein
MEDNSARQKLPFIEERALRPHVLEGQGLSCAALGKATLTIKPESLHHHNIENTNKT